MNLKNVTCKNSVFLTNPNKHLMSKALCNTNFLQCQLKKPSAHSLFPSLRERRHGKQGQHIHRLSLNVQLFPVCCVPIEAQSSTSAKMKCAKPQPQIPRSSFTQGCPSQETDQTTVLSIIYHSVYKLVN